MPANNTANVNARIDQNIETQAETILPTSSAVIDAYERPMMIPDPKLSACDVMSTSEFHHMMATGLAQAKADDSFDLEDVLSELEADLAG